MRTATVGFLVLILGMLAACAKPVDPAADRTARAFFTAVQAGDRTGIDAQLAPETAANPARFAAFDQIRLATPAGPQREARAVGGEAGKTPSTLHLYRYEGGDMVVRTNLKAVPGGFRVLSAAVSRPPPGAIDANDFGLSGKTPRQYGFLATAVISPLVMIGVALMALFTPGLRFRAVWALLALVGVGAATLNWTTGVGAFDPAQVSFINVGFTRASDISPWILRFSPPVGAIIVLVRLMFVRAREEKA
ncbi:MAG: hypothetical protein ABW360_15085 [Phenylobacterium sp.]